MSWMDDLKKIHGKSKVSVSEVNGFVLRHPHWAATIIRNALESEMYDDFCLFCVNFDKCWEKLGTIKYEPSLGCICNEFFSCELSDDSRQKLKAYFKEIAVILNI